MTVWLRQGLTAFVFFGALIPLLLTPWINRQYRRFGRFRGWPAIVSALTILYACALVAFTLFPIPDTSAPGFCSDRSLRSYWRLRPFNSLDDVTAFAAHHSLSATLTSGVFLQVMLNVLFFVPLGFLIAYRWRRPWWTALLASFGLSLFIEATQGTALWGLVDCPYRRADVDDLLTNTVGGMLGWCLGLLAVRLLPSAVPEPHPDLAPPTLRRQALAAALDVLVYVLLLTSVLLVAVAVDEPLSLEGRPIMAVSAVITLVVFVGIPALRRDRASPGMASVDVALVRNRTLDPAPRLALLIRWAVRWLPVVVFGLVALAVLLVVDAIVAWRRQDGRSLSAVLSGTDLVTLSATRGSLAILTSP